MIPSPSRLVEGDASIKKTHHEHYGKEKEISLNETYSEMNIKICASSYII